MPIGIEPPQLVGTWLGLEDLVALSFQETSGAQNLLERLQCTNHQFQLFFILP
jgi:hypothetical protein